MIVILGAPGGGTSFFTKFLRYNGFYAGRSIEEGRDNKDHIGYLYNRKWHESIVYSEHFCKRILKELGVGESGYKSMFSNGYRRVVEEINNKTQIAIKWFTEDNLGAYTRMYNDEFPNKMIPHGFKNPRSFLIIPFIKQAYPFAKLLTVERKMNPNPSSQGPEGKAFARNINDPNYVKTVYGHDDDFRFQFEDFQNVVKVNELLKFVGLKELTEEQLYEQLTKLKFNVSKIGK